VIENFGLLDERYGRGYNEENDFCSRINRFGYSAIRANRAYVFHHESQSFGEDKKKLEKQNRHIEFNEGYTEIV
jgi:GT2 family glycosyltransferase